MGISPRGSNGRPRATLIFKDTASRDIFKALSADIAERDHVAPTEAVLGTIIHSVASTPEGERVVRATYSSSAVSCKTLFTDYFRQLMLAGHGKRDALPIVKMLFAHITRVDACIDTTRDEIAHLVSLWNQLVDILDQLATTGDPDALLAAENARTVGVGVLRDSHALVSPSALVHLLQENWAELHDYLVAYAILHEVSRLMCSTRRGITETARDRLDLLRAIDTFYEGERR